MPKFAYQSRDNAGALMSGAIAAGSLEEASKLLRAEGKFIIKLAPAGEVQSEEELLTVSQHAKRCKRQDVIVFANQMAVMIETGVPISEALECVTEQANSEHFKAVAREVKNAVQAGGELSAALKKFPKVFPPVMTSLVKASEVSGTMAQLLDRIARYLTKEQQTLKKVKGALSYPIFMLVMAVSVTGFLLGFVLPKFASIYGNRGATLPAPTRLLMGMSEVLQSYWYLLLAGTVAAAVGGYFFARTPSGRRCFDWIKLNTPVIRDLFRLLYVSRAARTMGTMISAGVSVLDMIAIVKQVTNNVYFEELWDEVDQRLRQGSQLSEPLFRSTLMPRSVTQMIHSGEKSGRLGPTMSRIAEFTEEEFDTAVKTTTQFIEPVMVGVMGVIVGFVAVSLLLPIFSVGKVVAGG